jgi:hypothetical protein
VQLTLRLSWLVFPMVVAAVAILLWWKLTGAPPKPPLLATTSNAGLTIEQVRMLSTLTTLRVEVADASVTDLRGYLGGMKAVLVVKGDVTLGVDLSAARFEKVDRKARTAVLVLPQPAVQSARVDHERSRLVDLHTGGVWLIVPGGGEAQAAVVDRAYRDAQRIVGAAAEDPAMRERARRQAEQVLGAFFRAADCKVSVRWAE